MKKSIKSTIKSIQPQFITDKAGSTEYVVLRLEDYHQLLEDYEDLAIVASRRDDERIPLDSLEKKLKASGRL